MRAQRPLAAPPAAAEPDLELSRHAAPRQNESTRSRTWSHFSGRHHLVVANGQVAAWDALLARWPELLRKCNLQPLNPEVLFALGLQLVVPPDWRGRCFVQCASSASGAAVHADSRCYLAHSLLHADARGTGADGRGGQPTQKQKRKQKRQQAKQQAKKLTAKQRRKAAQRSRRGAAVATTTGTPDDDPSRAQLSPQQDPQDGPEGKAGPEPLSLVAQMTQEQRMASTQTRRVDDLPAVRPGPASGGVHG